MAKDCLGKREKEDSNKVFKRLVFDFRLVDSLMYFLGFYFDRIFFRNVKRLF